MHASLLKRLREIIKIAENSSPWRLRYMYCSCLSCLSYSVADCAHRPSLASYYPVNTQLHVVAMRNTSFLLCPGSLQPLVTMWSTRMTRGQNGRYDSKEDGCDSFQTFIMHLRYLISSSMSTQRGETREISSPAVRSGWHTWRAVSDRYISPSLFRSVLRVPN